MKNATPVSDRYDVALWLMLGCTSISTTYRKSTIMLSFSALNFTVVIQEVFLVVKAQQ